MIITAVKFNGPFGYLENYVELMSRKCSSSPRSNSFPCGFGAKKERGTTKNGIFGFYGAKNVLC